MPELFIPLDFKLINSKRDDADEGYKEKYITLLEKYNTLLLTKAGDVTARVNT
jgi:hypothetical protein